jgi:hypothetical protein
LKSDEKDNWFPSIEVADLNNRVSRILDNSTIWGEGKGEEAEQPIAYAA